MKRRRLTHDERFTYLTEVARLIVKERMQKRDALMRAVVVLPEAKRQPDYKHLVAAYRSWLEPELDKEIERLQLQTAVEEVASAPAGDPTPPPPAPVDISEFSTEDLMRELLARVLSNVTRSFDQSLREVLTPHSIPIGVRVEVSDDKNPTESATKKILPRIGIVGLLPNQQKLIRNEFAEDIDVRFLRQQHNDLKFFGDYKHVLCMRGFMSHAHTEKIKSMKLPFTMCSGMSDLRDKLTELWIKYAGEGDTSGARN